jgi:hypothetical protein
MGKAYKIFTGKPEWKKIQGRYRRKYENNIKIDLKEIVCVSSVFFRLGMGVH